MNERIKHSKLGIASTIMAIGVWIYFVIMLYLFFNSEAFTGLLNSLLPSSQGISDFRVVGGAIVLIAFLLVGIPLAGHLSGFILAVTGSFVKTRKRTFAVIGLVLNTLPFVIGFALYLIGSNSA